MVSVVVPLTTSNNEYGFLFVLESSKVNKNEEKVAKRVAKTAEEKIDRGWK